MKAFKKIIQKARHHWLTIAFVLGFVTDNILLNQVDNFFDNLVLLFYAILATISLLLLYVGVAQRAPAKLASFLTRYAPISMQYSFGGLLSGMLIFYGRSGDWLASWPFLLLILAVIFGNELVEKRSDRLVYQLSLYFIGIFSYLVLVIPVVTGKMGDGIFILSGLIALLIVTFVAQVLHRIVPNFMFANTRRVIMTVGLIYIGFNVLYFTSLIPPIPLSLTKLEIVQSVSKTSSGYRVTAEVKPWYTQLPFIKATIHPTGNSLACFSRVFAPTKLSTKIYNRWEYKDVNGDWQERFRFGYDISGVNKNGYGGYTILDNFSNGIWRCSVETERGQVLGRETVMIDTIGQAEKIITTIE